MNIIWFMIAVGCSKLGNVGDALEAYKPKVKFQRLDLREIDFQQVKTSLVFDVNNPNPINLGLASFDYTLSLEEQRITAGEKSKGFQVPAEGQAELKIPLALVFADIPELLDRTRGKDELGFRVQGDMGFNTPLGVVKLPYDADGTMPVIRPPKFSFNTIRVENLAPLKNTATLAVVLDVANRGGATIQLKDVDYALNLNQKRIANGAVAQLGAVSGQSQQTVTVPINFTLTELGSGLIELITNRGQVSAKWHADLTVDTPFGGVPLTVDETGKIKLQ